MKNRDAFSGCHPLVNFIYFGWVIGFSVFFMHPVCLLISIVSAFCYHIQLKRKGTGRFLVRFILPILILTALINPAFNHQGVTVLCYLPTGNPLTLESILYGIAAALMLAAVLLWFGCYTEVMTSDKFIYLFGRIVPALSLVLSMTLRLVPKFKEQFNTVKEAQAANGRDFAMGSLWKRFRCALTCFSITVTWALENSIESADSMKDRGYGLKGRTAFSIYTLTERDKGLLVWLTFCGFYILNGSLSGRLFWQFFPSVRGILTEPLTVSFQFVYLALCMTPTVMNIKEAQKWKSLKSKI